MTSFEKKEFTAIPNELFPMIPEMGNPELRFTLVLLRETSGFHRRNKTLSTTKLMTLTGMSLNSVIKGSRKALKRGTVNRLNDPDDKKSTEWEINWVRLSSSKYEEDKNKHLQNLKKTSSKYEEQLGVKEILKKTEEEKKEGAGAAARVFSFCESEFGEIKDYMKSKLTKAILDFSEAWVLEALGEAVENKATNWFKYMMTILNRWKKDGKVKTKGNNFGKSEPAGYKHLSPKSIRL